MFMETVSYCGVKGRTKKLEGINEANAANWVCPPPETPTESMEFLARSWSLSATELSKALCQTKQASHLVDKISTSSLQAHLGKPSIMKDPQQQTSDSPPVSPRGSDDTKELFLLHQALNPDFLSNQHLLKAGLYRTVMRGKTMGRWLKDQKEKKKQELRTQSAQVHAAVSVAAVAAAVAALATTSVTSPDKSTMAQHKKKTSSKMSASIASAAALVASHCIEIAEDMGADQDQILLAVNSAINAKTSGDIMTLTAGAATALRGAAMLRARLQKGNSTAAVALPDEHVEGNKESTVTAALSFVAKGGELLKRTRKGDLHWKQVSFSINSDWQVIAKLKSKHMAGTFTKKKECVISGIYCNMPAWPERDEEVDEDKCYFGVQTADRIIEFECRSKGEKQMWVDGIQQMMCCHITMT